MTKYADITYDTTIDGVWFDNQVFISSEAIFRAAATIITAQELEDAQFDELTAA